MKLYYCLVENNTKSKLTMKCGFGDRTIRKCPSFLITNTGRSAFMRNACWAKQNKKYEKEIKLFVAAINCISTCDRTPPSQVSGLVCGLVVCVCVRLHVNVSIYYITKCITERLSHTLYIVCVVCVCGYTARASVVRASQPI